MENNLQHGCIVINTTLDKKGFKRGSKKFKNAINDLVKSTDDLAKNIIRHFK